MTTMQQDTIVATPQIVSHRVQTEDGTWVTLNEARSPGGLQQQPIDIGSHANPGQTSGKRPTLTTSGRRRIWMYRGAVGSLVPEAQMLFFLGKGFTVAPTAEGIPLAFECGVQMSDGLVCHKKVPSMIDRLRHIQGYHSDVAAWTMTDQEKRALRGDLGVGTVDTTHPGASSAPNTEVADLRAELAALKAMMRDGAGTHLREAAIDVAVAERPKAQYGRNQTKHNHKAPFGGAHIVAGCPRCEEM